MRAGDALRLVVGELAQEAGDLGEEAVEVVSRVEEAAVGRERARDVGERELVVPLGGVAVRVEQLVLVEVHDARDARHRLARERHELREVHEGATRR